MNNKVISLKREIKDDYNYRESLKTLRTNIQFCGSNIRTIMFTSALPDEGKSDVAFSVAASFAQIGKLMQISVNLFWYPVISWKVR